MTGGEGVPMTSLRRGGVLAALALMLTFAGAASSAVRTESTQKTPRTHFDVRNLVLPTQTASRSTKRTVSQLDARMQFNPRIGAPFVIMKDGGTLTGARQGTGVAIARDFVRA